MPICPLPKETVRLLGSPLVYSTPVAVVKELVDNALDAHATSVEVLVSANTVDSIEVRDNGHGIHPSDFISLGYRGCTSKLRTFEDIQTVGGTTLGFRGDALACAANLSTLQIITRTAGEPTASKLYFSEKAGVEKIERVSGPVGTAVKVTDLFARLPVRKQVALKEVSKTVSGIRDLLQSYAFARPQIKLTFRVLNQPKTSWSYSPGSHGNIKQAAFQVFGADLVSQCIEKSNKRTQRASNAPGNELTGVFKVQGTDVYTIDALLPKLDADPTKISKGAWFSVDSRPLSCSKGTIQALYSAFKARFKRTLQSPNSTTTLKNPFLAVNIDCPPNSYDPNVEPSKDEVLFANSHHLVEVFERFLEEAYPVTPPPSSSPEGDDGTQLPAKVSPQASEAFKPDDQGSHLLSPEYAPADAPPSPSVPGTNTSVSSWVQGLLGTNRRAPQKPHTSPRMTAIDIKKLDQAAQAAQALHYKSPPSSGGPEPGRESELHASGNTGLEDDGHGQTSSGWKVDMSSHNDDDGTGTAIISLSNSRNEEAGRDPANTQPMQGVNPWVIAKFNAIRNRQPDVVPQPAQQTSLPPGDPHPTIVEADSAEARHILGMRPVVRLDSEGTSGQQVLTSIPAALPALHVPGGAYRPPMSSPRVGDSDAAQGVQRQVATRRGPQRSLASLRHGDRAFRKPGGNARQQPAQEDQENNWFQGSLDSTHRRSNRHQRGRPGASGSLNVNQASHGLPSQDDPSVNLDLGAIRRRQVLAENRRRREPLGGWLDTSDPESAGAIVTSMEAPVQPPQAQPDVLRDKVAVKAGLSPGDPRAYLMRKEYSLPATTPRKLRRVKSCMLPLETTPAGEETHNLVQAVHVNMEELCEMFDIYRCQYLTDATVDNALVRAMDGNDLKEVCHRVTELLSNLGLVGPDNGCQIEFNVPRAELAITAGS